jgi:hypothetical protein
MSTPPLPDLPTATMVADLVASLGFTVVRERLGLHLPPAPALHDDTALVALVDETPWARARLASLYRWQQRRALGRGRRRHGDDLRGLGTAVVTATTSVTDVVQGMHDAIGAVPIITDLVYRGVRGVTNLVGSGVDVLVASLTPFLGDSAPGLQREAVVAALNGVVGDHLAATNNPLAIHMALRPPLDGWHDGQVLLVMVHGSSASDMQWRWEGHDHGVALAMELGFTPLYAHYNSGLHVSDNGAQLAALLEQEAGPFREVIVLAHSMGGLVSRSALQAGAVAGHSWRTKVRVLVTLGSPHEGAPLERSGNVFESLLGVTPWTAPLQALARVRSAGITDLRHGNIVEADWRDRDRFERGPDPRTPTPLPEDLRCYAVAATGSPEGTPFEDLAGDTLVPVPSALGMHDDERFRLRFTATRIVYDTHHLSLLSSPTVSDQLVDWLADLAPVPRPPVGERSS